MSGYNDYDEILKKASSMKKIKNINIPCLVIKSDNDPIIGPMS